jgi:ribose transport system ATP-binding protein
VIGADGTHPPLPSNQNMTNTPLVRIAHANKTYNGIPALIDVSLDLHGGEVHALMGENGAGKSTLIKLLAGVVAPDSMHVEVRGMPVSIGSAQRAFDLGFRFVHQELNVVPQLSVGENIYISHPYETRGGVFGGLFVHWSKLFRNARAVLEGLGITHIDPRTVISRLSPGDQMLVKIAAAFAKRDEVGSFLYVMDEPTAALTGEESAMLFRVSANCATADRRCCMYRTAWTRFSEYATA